MNNFNHNLSKNDTVESGNFSDVKLTPVQKTWFKKWILTEKEVQELALLQHSDFENQTVEEKKRELFLYYLTKETLTREETQELIDLTFSDQKESERANFLWAKVERK